MTAENEKQRDPRKIIDGPGESSGEHDIEAQMAAAMAAEDMEEQDSDNDLEAQMAAAMASDAEGEREYQTERPISMPERDGKGIRESDNFLEAFRKDDSSPNPAVQPVRFQQLRPTDESNPQDDISRLLDVSLNISVELGRKQMQIKEILELGPGKIVELEKLAGEPVDLLVNGKLLARGEVVVVDENFGVRITELIDPKDRIKML